MKNNTHRFNFETDAEEKKYDKLVKICKAPLDFIEENIQRFDLDQYTPTSLARQLEREYKKEVEG